MTAAEIACQITNFEHTPAGPSFRPNMGRRAGGTLRARLPAALLSEWCSAPTGDRRSRAGGRGGVVGTSRSAGGPGGPQEHLAPPAVMASRFIADLLAQEESVPKITTTMNNVPATIPTQTAALFSPLDS